jgi:hypothetical protein
MDQTASDVKKTSFGRRLLIRACRATVTPLVRNHFSVTALDNVAARRELLESSVISANQTILGFLKRVAGICLFEYFCSK